MSPEKESKPVGEDIELYSSPISNEEYKSGVVREYDSKAFPEGSASWKEISSKYDSSKIK